MARRSTGLIRVLESVAPPGRTTKFIDQVVRFAPANIAFRYFSWGTALFGVYDVFHVHWPEFLVRATNPVVGLARRMLFKGLLVRLRMQRIPVVRTLHNVSPHTPGSQAEARLLRGLEDMTTLTIRLNDATATDESTSSRTILHGHYVDEFATYPPSRIIRGRITYVGRIEPYKGVLELVDAFATLDDPDLSLRIVGRPTPDLRSAISSRLEEVEHASALLEYVSDEQMVAEITSAELVVLPYREMHNSGILLVALSLARPVLVPRTRANELIASEVGDGWVLQYDGEVSAEAIRLGVDSARRSRDGEVPALLRRDWPTVAAQYAEAFTEAIAVDVSSEVAAR